MRQTIFSLGANAPGSAETLPTDAVLAAAIELDRLWLGIRYVSSIYSTSPVGGGWQPDYANMVIVCDTTVPPWRMLTLLKQIEWSYGRRPGRRWSRRVLDIDIVDHRGQIVAWPPTAREWRRLCLPHPRAHDRAFVLRPIAETGFPWRHPVLDATAGNLLRRLRPVDRRMEVLVPQEEVWQTIRNARSCRSAAFPVD